jgi:hypothetical protein
MQPIQINIAEPCHENWSNMNATEQGRFCSSCQKEVVDFSVMEDPEIFLTLQKAEQSNQSICGRVYHTQLNRPIVSTTQKVKNQIAWYWKYITAFFLFSTEAKVFAQKNTPPKETVTKLDCTRIKMGITVAVSQRIKEIVGIVVNEKNEPLPYANIKIKGNKKIITTDSTGRFTINANKYSDTLEISFLNVKKDFALFNQHSDNFVLEIVQKNEEVAVVSTLRDKIEMQYLTGTIAVVEVETIPTKKDSSITVVTHKKAAVNQTIKMYPNPVAQNGITYIQIDHQEAHTMRIVNASGIVFQTNSINNLDSKKKIQLRLNEHIIPGFYTLEVININGNIITTSNFIVQ